MTDSEKKGAALLVGLGALLLLISGSSSKPQPRPPALPAPPASSCG